MENAGLIFTSLVSLLVSVAALVTGFSFLKHKKIISNSFLSFAYFLLATGIVWFFISLELLMSWLDKHDIDRLFFFANQVFVFLTGPILAYHLSLKIFKKEKLTKIVTALYLIVAIVGIIFLFSFGVTEKGETYFSDKIQPNQPAFYLFAAMIVPLFIFSFFDSLVRFILWITKKRKSISYDFFYSLIIAVYLFLGAFDERGFVAGWELVFFRLVFALIFLSAYIVFYFQFYKRDYFIEELPEQNNNNNIRANK